MTKEELIKQLEELRDIKDYSQSKLLNTGYRTGLLDALDLVNKYFDLALVSGRSEQFSCPLPETKGCDRHKIDDEEGRWEFCNTCKKEWAR